MKIKKGSMLDLYASIDINKLNLNNPDVQVKLKQANPRAYNWAKKIETASPIAPDKDIIDTKLEYIEYIFNAGNLSVIEPQAREIASKIPSESKILEEIFILNNLKRIYPDRVVRGTTDPLYGSAIDTLRNDNNLSQDTINQYTAKRFIENLQKSAANNKYFTFYIPGTKQINQDMNKILQYLMNPNTSTKQEIINMAIDMVKKVMIDGRDSVAYKKYNEYYALIFNNYSDILVFSTDATRGIH